MASNKKTTKPCFSNGTEAMVWEDSQCQHCTKYTTYNTKLGRYPAFKCAIQRDIELQQVGNEEISLRSWEACQQKECPYKVSKDKPKEEPLPRRTSQVAPQPIFGQKAINITEEAEKMRQTKLKEARNKEVDMALAKAFDRRMNREAIVPKKKELTLTPELQEAFKKKGEEMKVELDSIVRMHLSSLHIILQCMLDVGDGVAQDCIREMKSRGIYKRELKMQVGKAQAAFKKVYNRILALTSEVEELRNIVLDDMSDKVKDDVKLLTFSLKSVLDKYKIEDSMFVAQLDTAFVMFESARLEAKIIYDTARNMMQNVFIREGIKIPSGFNEEFNAFFRGKFPDGVAKEWQKVSEMICPYVPEVSKAMSNDENVKNATRIIQRKLGDVDAIENLSNGIIRDNPQIIERYKQRHPDWDKELAI